MSDLNVQLVRECFELNLFQVLPYWQHDPPASGAWPARPSDTPLLLFVENTRPDIVRRIDFLLEPGDISGLQRAVVEVRAWHADRFYPSVIEANPVLGHVAYEETRQLAGQAFADRGFSTLLVISELPASPEPRERSIRLLRDLEIDHIVEFPTILEELLVKISAYGQYAPSATLQTLRLLKRYNLVRRLQLEFAFATEPPPSPVAPEVHARVPEGPDVAPD